MIDLRFLRENPDVVRQSQKSRDEDVQLVDDLLEADQKRRELRSEYDELRAEQRRVSSQIGKVPADERPAAIAAAQDLKEKVEAAKEQADFWAVKTEQLNTTMANLVDPAAPVGDADAYAVLRHEGPKPRDFEAEGFEPKDHLELAEGLNAIDMKRGAKVSGTRFYYMSGIGARLELALLSMAVDQAVADGFIMQMTPTLVRPEIMQGTGFLGDHSDEVYYLPEDDLYLTGTSEVALAGLHADEILDLDDLPIRYVGWSTCYRREAGAAGRDTRGIIRVHQFNKVEMFSYIQPDQAEEEHLRLLAWEEEMLAKMELPYRVIDTATGDLGASAARKYDCEAWLPTQQRWMELTSTSNCTTFQARRLKIRYRGDGGGTETVATLNGTLATTRWLVALLENHQNEDGSVNVPKAMRPYLGGLEVLKPGE